MPRTCDATRKQVQMHAIGIALAWVLREPMLTDARERWATAN